MPPSSSSSSPESLRTPTSAATCSNSKGGGMKVDLAAVVLGWDKALGSADHVLSKGVEYAQEKGIAEAEMLGWQLAPDMFPLRRQVQIVCNVVQQWASRAAEIAAPPAPAGETV